jgi:hypothetical protein
MHDGREGFAALHFEIDGPRFFNRRKEKRGQGKADEQQTRKNDEEQSEKKIFHRQGALTKKRGRFNAARGRLSFPSGWS